MARRSGDYTPATRGGNEVRPVKKCITALLLVCMLFTWGKLPVQAGQNAYITFEGNKESGQFYFGPGTNFSSSDMFPELKELMPGDEKSQTIRVNNHASANIELVLYVRSSWVQTSANDSSLLGNEITISFTADGKAERFDTSPVSQEQLDGWVLVGELNSGGSSGGIQDLTQWTYLGTLHVGGEVDIQANVHVPLTLNNEYQEREGQVDILVQAEANRDTVYTMFPEEDGKRPSDSSGGGQPPQTSVLDIVNAKTGDTASVLLWMVLAAVSADALFLMWKKHKKNRDEKREAGS